MMMDADENEDEGLLAVAIKEEPCFRESRPDGARGRAGRVSRGY